MPLMTQLMIAGLAGGRFEIDFSFACSACVCLILLLLSGASNSVFLFVVDLFVCLSVCLQPTTHAVGLCTVVIQETN